MVQEFNVLVCYACNTFQVHQVKKSSNKWVCKLCGEKQSVKQIFFRGNGKDCRVQVQKLNMMKSTVHQKMNIGIRERFDSNRNEDYESETTGIRSTMMAFNRQTLNGSKWTKFMDHKECQDTIVDEADHEPNVTTDRATYNSILKQQRQNNRLSMAYTRQPRATPYDRVSTKNNAQYIGKMDTKTMTSVASCSTLANSDSTQGFGNYFGTANEKPVPITSNEPNFANSEREQVEKGLPNSAPSESRNQRTSVSKWDFFL